MLTSRTSTLRRRTRGGMVGTPDATTLETMLYRLRRAVAAHGLLGTARKAGERLRRTALLAESHVWYVLDVTAERPVRSLESGLDLRRALDTEVSLFDELKTISPREALARMRAGNDQWLVLEGDRPLFSCTIFRERLPVLAAPGRELALPADIVALEDSITSPAARGRGIAPAAWDSIARELAAEGLGRLITKVTVENIPSRRAVEKAGFDPVALMHFKRVGPWSRTSVEVVEFRKGEFFAAALAS